ncbi:RPAP1-like, carboxy-terminal protein isoform X2 [Wolffia australiana]
MEGRERSSKLPEEQRERSFLVGRIVEKGFSTSAKSTATPALPRPSVLPFPVARHRSRSPYWTPAAAGKDQEGDEEEGHEDIGDYGLAAPLAGPMKRKEKKDLNFGRLRELLDPNNSSSIKEEDESANPEAIKSHLKRKELDGKASSCLSAENRELHSGSTTDVFKSDERKNRGVDFHSVRKSDVMGLLNSKSDHQGMVSMEDDIDRENILRLSQMSPQEIENAQSELLQKMNPSMLEMLKKRGQDKKGFRRSTAAEEKRQLNLMEEAKLNMMEDANYRITEPAHGEGKGKAESTSGSQKIESSVVSNEWKSWCERVEKVRDLRFSLDGNVVNVGSPMEIENDVATSFSQYTPNNVAERDFLRTEGDPGGAGYTLKEAIALCRSLVPSQRCFALQLLNGVLNKCLNKLQRKDDDANVMNANSTDRAEDWQAVWAYVLGPELEIALLLRMSLDDTHDSVILGSARVIQSVLSFDVNEQYFNLSEKLCLYESDVYTAPILRGRPDINLGYLHGGFWKYSSKPSNILPFDDQEEDVNVEGERTIQDDVVVAGQDIAAGLIRMGLLPRICYLLEVEPLPSLEECLLAILAALARHSPTSATAVMNCPRLIETIVGRFTQHSSLNIYPAMIKSVLLLRILSQADRKNCTAFVRRGFFRDVTWHMYRGPFSLEKWNSSGKDRINLASLTIQQLRFWKICIGYGYCISYFEEFFPFISTWLGLPTLENILEEYLLITREVYHVLETLSHRLPGLHSETQLKKEVSSSPADVELWSWGIVVPMVDVASKWLSLETNSIMAFLLAKNNNSIACCVVGVISAVFQMLASIFDKVNPEGAPRLRWLPFFVPKVGLEIVKNEIFDFSHLNIEKKEENASFTTLLSQWRYQNSLETSLCAVSCLHGLVRLVSSVDKCIQSAKASSKILYTYQEIQSASSYDQILEDGIAKNAFPDLARVFSTLVPSQKCFRQGQSEVFGRGGPAPGIGFGWGSSDGGYWSTKGLYAQADAHLIISLFNIFQNEEVASKMMVTHQVINVALGVCLVLGPRDRDVLEKALEFLLQPRVLEFMDKCISDTSPQYCTEDYNLFHESLIFHFRSIWLGHKRKSESSGKVNDESIKRDTLEMIPEDMDTCPCSFLVEWARQRLPLPSHWFLSPLLCCSSDDFLNVAKSGLFFLLALEAMSANSSEFDSQVLSVPLTWKLHALSAVLLVRNETEGVLEDGKSRDNYNLLQELYGKQLDQLRHQTGRLAEASLELLGFRSQVHETYGTFVENLVEQFGAVSYGNMLYGRQVALYLHRAVEAAVRLVAWNSITNSHVLDLLPQLNDCLGTAEGYLEPIEDNEEILEAYAKTWVSGSLERAASRRSITFILPLHHLSCFIFYRSSGKIPLRNKLVKLLLRGYARKPQLKKMLLDLIDHGQNGEFSHIQEAESMRRFDILFQACEGNNNLLSELAKLK